MYLGHFCGMLWLCQQDLECHLIRNWVRKSLCTECHRSVCLAILPWNAGMSVCGQCLGISGFALPLHWISHKLYPVSWEVGNPLSILSSCKISQMKTSAAHNHLTVYPRWKRASQKYHVSMLWLFYPILSSLCSTEMWPSFHIEFLWGLQAVV